MRRQLTVSRTCARTGNGADRGRRTLPSATLNGRKLGTFGLASAFSLFSNKVLSVGEGGLLVTDDDAVAALARRLRNHAMTLTSWDKHKGAHGIYDVPALGFNYRIDEPRSALALSRLTRLEEEIACRRELTVRYRAELSAIAGRVCALPDDDVETSSCYVMPILLSDPRVAMPSACACGSTRSSDEHLLPADSSVQRLSRALSGRFPAANGSGREQ